MNFKISPADLKLETISEIFAGNARLSLSEESVNLITLCRNYLDRKLENTTSPIYGCTTKQSAKISSISFRRTLLSHMPVVPDPLLEQI